VFAEAVAVAIIDGYPTTASSVLLFSKQALQHCFNSRARQIFDGHAASSQAFRRRRASRPRCRQQPSCSTTKRHEAENASDLKVQVATSSQAIRQRRADYFFYVFAEPSPSPSLIAIRRQHRPFCYSRSKLFNTASTRERAKFNRAIVAHLHFRRLFQIFDGHAASSQAFRRRRASRPRCRQQPSCSTTKRHEAENASDLKVQVATSSQAIRQRRADYFYVFAEPSPSPSLIAIRRQHRPFCYSRSKLFNTASTRERAKFQQSYCCAFAFLKTVSGF